ncbi:MAG: triose-phosphate isomerase, partial [Nitrososphaerales archaeon]
MRKPGQLFVINFKNYMEVSGRNSLKLAKAAEYVAGRSRKEIIVAPPPGSLAYIANFIRIPVFAQHLDHSAIGNTTGFMVPEIAKSYGISGSLINHSEHRIPVHIIRDIVLRLHDLKMISVVCARTPQEVK